MKSFAAALASGLVLAGLSACASPEELRAQDMAACAGYGFQQNTPEFATCMQRENLARRSYLYAPAPYGPFGPYYGPYGYSGGAHVFWGY